MSNIPDVQETLNQPAPAPSAEVTNDQVPTKAPATEQPAPEARGSEVLQSDAKPSAVSSTAGDKDANKKPTLEDVIQDGFKGKADSDSSAEGDSTESAEAKNAEEQGSRDDAQAPKDGSQKQADKVPFHNHPRWKEMLAERDALKPKAEQFDKIENFMKTNALSPDEMAEGLKVMALMKLNPVEAHKALKGYVDQLAPLAGEVLPEDLKKEVEEGFIEENRAKELARLKAEREYAFARQKEVAEQQERARAVAFQQEVATAVSAWERTEQARDPEWSVKQEMVLDRVKALLASERPSNPSEAVELARRALADVNSRLRPILGRAAIPKGPTSSLSSANTRPKPASLDDLVRMGLNS